MSHIKAKRFKYQIEVEASIDGDNSKLQEVAEAIRQGAEVNIIDIDGVNNVEVNLSKVTKFVEEDINIFDDNNTLDLV